ncbi:MAG: AAA family ATPase [Burkholderiales bacterium]|nr:AAA family ATPase [Burkholderiales bacterium]
MRKRGFWLRMLRHAWRARSVVWLSGVRRVGKTTLCQSLEGAEYFDCELPRVRRLMGDPQAFLHDLRGRMLVLDEVHRLANPAEVLKIAADHFPDTWIIATGSSTLGASARFRDTLAGRKVEIWLTPMMSADLDDFGRPDLRHRLLHWGLPPFFLAREPPERDFQEWMDAYWAKDIEELFRLERRHSFQRFAELLFAQSGAIFEATRFARACEVSRPTIVNYLAVLEATYVVHVVRPFSARRATEIVPAPRIYGFDTGFVCYHRGWHALRTEDLEPLWEHFVLNEIHARLQTRKLHCWRDKRGHEVDFVLVRQGEAPIAIECAWSSGVFDPAGLLAFRRQHPAGRNFVVAADVKRSFRRAYPGCEVEFVGLSQLMNALGARPVRAGPAQ